VLSQVAGSSLNWDGSTAVIGMAQALPIDEKPLLVPVCVHAGKTGRNP